MERLWLADGVGGECEREAGGVGFSRKDGCCPLILVLNNIIAWISSSFFQALKDKGEGWLL
jgi:hypothetical protein